MTSRRLVPLLLAALCAGCAGGSRYTAHWDGRRGYDGNGDYGYDIAASQSEARGYAAQASRNYPAPGTPDDPWGPYIQPAAARFGIPARWIREVMRQESSFRQYDRDGSLMTSSTGAMGLMQVMPRTYDALRQKYGLGSDPYEPSDNILAGAAYIREMFDQYGSPGFLAAYNAGPNRLDSYLAGSTPLPDETVNYLARIAPRLGTEIAMSGPLATYAGGGVAGSAATASASIPMESGGGDPADRAFAGGGLVTADAPTGILTAAARPAAAYYAPSPVPVPEAVPEPVRTMPAGRSMLGARSPPPSMLMAPAPAAPLPVVLPVVQRVAIAGGDWGIQVGAYPDPANSRAAVSAARARASDLLGGTQPAILPVQHGGMLYRARLVGLSSERAGAACARLSAQGMDCFAVPPGS